MERKTVSPNDYHRVGFRVDRLPDIEAAGPISASVLSAAKDLPLMLQRSGYKVPTPDMVYGSLVDTLWTDPSSFDRDFAVIPKDAPKDLRHLKDAKNPAASTLASIKFWNDFDQKSIGKHKITPETLQQAQEAVGVLNRYHLTADIIEGSQTQLALFGRSPFQLDQDSNIMAKCLMDIVKPVSSTGWVVDLYDLKQRHDLSDQSLSRGTFDFEYFLKMAFYRECCRAAGMAVGKVALIYQLSRPPYEVKVKEINPIDLELGAQLCQLRLFKLSKTIGKDILMNFEGKIGDVSLTPWQRQEIEREIERGP